MSQPSAFEKLRNRKAEEQTAATARAKKIREERDAEETALYKKFQKALVPYEDCILTDDYKTKRKVRVRFKALENKAEVFFDGHHFLTFQPKRHYSGCHCEGPCEHEMSTWITLNVTQHQKRKGYENYGCWFGVGSGEHEIEDENSWAEAMNRMLTDFRNSGWVKE